MKTKKISNMVVTMVFIAVLILLSISTIIIFAATSGQNFSITAASGDSKTLIEVNTVEDYDCTNPQIDPRWFVYKYAALFGFE